MKKTIFISSLLLSISAYSKDNNLHYEKAVFAGGCFWCLESDFQYMQNHTNLSHGGIKQVVSGYDGGTKKNPNYKTVSAGITNYKESVEVIYNPDKISYKELVEYFYRRIDPTDNKGQFCDKGKQYQSAIYYTNESQQKIAEEVTRKLKEVFKKVDKPVYTVIV